ncbi:MULTISPECIES: flagellar hook assembly protein FlgD [unclassified Sulfitobacter]|uniref:flagellar hook assembly protein FlgD n=1 Tax=unclassified Sulfitobacter TaxID=196795 RepID=UPI0007C3101B|nr:MULTISPECIES: flagellar hook capping FlgD N-terminal domain-containing protein [unclassified Sulfitobacter]KZY02389.1 hypothetical protein A3721_19805 [Sulfitobacter sp. HI0023]KZY25343.1 hypothetical protein A3728_19230 [Sulfitobacter sp. HI0040]KZZ65177.1 hypothetical protein A3764_19165 [Sulfitobacter sp. HI0129]
MIDASTASGLAATAKASGAAASTEKLKESYDNFLTLLTAQISNQDPLKPVDSTQFVSQLAQLSQVEQGIAMNSNLETITETLATVGAMSDLQLIGREVLVPSSQVRMTQTDFPLSYQLNAGAEKVNMRIFSADGALVRELTGLPAQPDEVIPVEWDRRDRVGLAVPPGTFRVEIEATDGEGEPVGATVLTTAAVERVNFTGKGAELQLANGETVSSAAIRAAR